jgi:hypothetical protein
LQRQPSLALLGHDRLLADLLPGSDPQHMPTLLTLSGLLGILVASQTGRLADRSIRPSRLLKDPDRTFLLAWLLLEIVTYFGLSPFPARGNNPRGRRSGPARIHGLLP